MTTPQAAADYLADHLSSNAEKGYAVYNPKGLLEDQLPVIFGFNNGGSPGWFSAVLLAQDGTSLGGHLCSNEGYMPYDLGVLENSRPDRHETFREHYPEGYRMDFISFDDVPKTPLLLAAFQLGKAMGEAGDPT